MELNDAFNKARLDDKQMNELIGVCRGICADGAVNIGEAEYLNKWLVAAEGISNNPIITNLLLRVHEMLQDNFLDEEESTELLETLNKFTGGDFDLGEITKASALPFTDPQPDVMFKGKSFCFSGAFAFGSRKDCQNKIEELGGISEADISDKIDYLVLGVYVSSDWIHSSYGQKIQSVIKNKEAGSRLAIIGEEHWLKFI